MLKYSDQHSRYLFRLLTKKTLLYTEMVHANAVLKGDAKALLTFEKNQPPIALQLAGSDPIQLGKATAKVTKYNYTEINLNVGCPSKRVQAGDFGVSLFAKPTLVAEIVSQMLENSKDIPISVKTRLGIDELNTYDDLTHFIEVVSAVGCKKFIIHARFAKLKNLSPRQNRTQLALDYPRVWKLKQDFPGLEIIINGDIISIAQIKEQLTKLDGVMIGRAAFYNPYLLSRFDQIFFSGQNHPLSREEIVDQYLEYARKEAAKGTSLNWLLRPLMGIYKGENNAKFWRKKIGKLAKIGLDF
ncbi:MAG: tRNA dihydrouridine(20/20a) synthase DusA [Gammaproteobacteria bacterium]|nr:tRNA dihydrouridine(20/20a) synthase DusA [Gammaproteobacteria bacterium]